jgi:hypothetical protein
VPLDGPGCLFLPPSDAPSPRRLAFARLSPTFFLTQLRRRVGRERALLATKLGQQCCPIRNMANSGRQHKSETRRAIIKVRPRGSRPVSPRRPPAKWTTAGASVQWAGRRRRHVESSQASVVRIERSRNPGAAFEPLDRSRISLRSIRATFVAKLGRERVARTISHFHLSPLRGERSSEARVRGPLSDSERCNSEPSENAPTLSPPAGRGCHERAGGRYL